MILYCVIVYHLCDGKSVSQIVSEVPVAEHAVRKVYKSLVFTLRHVFTMSVVIVIGSLYFLFTSRHTILYASVLFSLRGDGWLFSVLLAHNRVCIVFSNLRDY